MASSRQATAPFVCCDKRYPPPCTPGPLGINDRADPNVAACFGDSPGPLGINDYADPDCRCAALRIPATYSVLLLDHERLARFLASVAYMEVMAETIAIEKNHIGLWFSSTQVAPANDALHERLIETRKTMLMDRFADACERGSVAAIAFLRAQEELRTAARARLQEEFAAVSRSNEATTESLERWIASLKTVEYGAAITLSVAGLLVTSAAALPAGIVGFAYDTAIRIIDNLREANTLNADALALVSHHVATDTFASLGKELVKTKLAGRELKDVEKLQKSVAHLHEKIAIKQAMIRETSSSHNAARLTRSIRKNEAALGEDLREIGRFKAVTVLFLALDVIENIEKIYKAWTHK